MGELNLEPWLRVKGNNVAFKTDQENVRSGMPTGSVRKVTIEVSGTTRISVQSQRHLQLLLQNLRRNRMEKQQREEKVQEAEVHLGECVVCSAQNTSKARARIHLVRNGILQNVYSTRHKRDADLGKSARMHTGRLKNSLARNLKRILTKVLWLC